MTKHDIKLEWEESNRVDFIKNGLETIEIWCCKVRPTNGCHDVQSTLMVISGVLWWLIPILLVVLEKSHLMRYKGDGLIQFEIVMRERNKSI